MPWDSSMRCKGKVKTQCEIAHIVYSRFVNGDTRDGIIFSLGGVYVYQYVKFVSKKAFRAIHRHCCEAIIVGHGIDHKILKPSDCGVTFEHVVPVAAAYNYLDDLYRRQKLNEKVILGIMPKLFLAIITKEENKKLVKAGLNSKMPNENWHTKSGDVWERYRVAGLKNDIWMDEFVK